MEKATPSASSVVNLAGDLPQETGTLFTVFPGTNKRTGWNIVLAGPSHPKTIALGNENERKRLHKAADIERTQVNGRKWKGDEEKQPEESTREFVEGLVGRIIGWNTVDFGWGPIEFNEKTAVDTLLNPLLGGYVAQIVNYLTAERAFYKSSAPN